MFSRLNKSTYILIFVAILVVAGVFYFNQEKEEYFTVSESLPIHYNGEHFAGSETCIACHQDIYQSHIQTAHYNTSAVASVETLKGSFNGSAQEVELIDGKAQILQEGDGFYQTIHSKTTDKLLDRSRLDIVVGSGVKGQSYLTFKGDSLYQLQVSYFTLIDDFINSPGYPNYKYTRAVTDNCVKCHVTFAKNEDPKGISNVYDRESFMLGIDCERCHGPLQKHVDFNTGNLNSTSIDPVVLIDSLSRQLQMDNCVQCHSGLRAIQIKENPFSFMVGDQLDTYAKNYNFGRPQAELDVHGNQYGLLKSSECFKNSETLSCTTCHDPHKKQRGDYDHFNSKCIECHAAPKNLHNNSGFDAANLTDCIGCHMPLFPSQTMKVKLEENAEETSVDIRTHLIGIYMDQVLQNGKE
ncbi:multiheme c-type cytochrome [Flagellimonas zhangzhouensis]|uniref:multiheme c-type cytochrome n=1 Tax=Flagellimonas zhangzhouensis TaxID=1073328 RepID=UPI00158634AF|nr:multiheme c-type cytochrome [Allomuricauda zhangzhouensis]